MSISRKNRSVCFTNNFLIKIYVCKVYSSEMIIKMLPFGIIMFCFIMVEANFEYDYLEKPVGKFFTRPVWWRIDTPGFVVLVIWTKSWRVVGRSDSDHRGPLAGLNDGVSIWLLKIKLMIVQEYKRSLVSIPYIKWLDSNLMVPPKLFGKIYFKTYNLTPILRNDRKTSRRYQIVKERAIHWTFQWQKSNGGV